MKEFKDGQQGAALAIHISAGMPKDMIFGLMPDGTVLVHLREKANTEHTLRRLFSKLIAIPPESIEFIGEEHSQRKIAIFLNKNISWVNNKIQQSIDDASRLQN